jgi:protein-disulfide isomerase
MLDLAATLLIIAAAVAVLFQTLSSWRQGNVPRDIGRRPPNPPLPTEPISLESAALVGSSTARIAMIEYSDFECPYCGTFARETLPALRKQYVDSGNLLIGFRHLILQRHQNARGLAIAAECAGAQHKFWQMHDLLFKKQEELSLVFKTQAAVTNTRFGRLASELGLDLELFSRCMSQRDSPSLQRDANTASALAVASTPTFFLGTLQSDGRFRVSHVIVGAQPIEQFTTIVDQLLTFTEQTAG